ncbi:MAG TPA: SDR family oxidoreductase [Candidatus Deferrimicrobiaceae bacterium]|nr:SDR family oxidoreductase [Candidatus Deferrimicrobiaceae bacterium]
MTRRLEGSAAVITGGAAGLGYAYARRFLEEGACVFIADITDPAAALGRLGAGDRAAGCRVDVASAPSVAAMVDEACRRLGRIDVLVNNAAVFATLTPRPFDAIPEEEWDRVMTVNVRGMFLFHYVTSKGAVIAMTRALARELGDDGIAVNAVAPGLILSDTVQANPAVTGFQAAAVLQSRAFKRDALPEDVEGAVLFLASADSAFMTGQTLVVDGGSVFL